VRGDEKALERMRCFWLGVVGLIGILFVGELGAVESNDIIGRCGYACKFTSSVQARASFIG